jgi:hypothetical protein
MLLLPLLEWQPLLLLAVAAVSFSMMTYAAAAIA